jgi:hypothetical protein
MTTDGWWKRLVAAGPTRAGRSGVRLFDPSVTRALMMTNLTFV